MVVFNVDFYKADIRMGSQTAINLVLWSPRCMIANDASGFVSCVILYVVILAFWLVSSLDVRFAF